jgi:proline iminopeptidase
MAEPYDRGMLEVGDGQRIYWEVCGNPAGRPAVVLHGGPGSGAGPAWRHYFDADAYRIVLFDQRGCGRSTPHASDPSVDLSVNTTPHLIADIERLRAHLGIDRWLVLGASWGSTLGLAYAERFPERVSAMVLFSVVTTSRREVQWVTRGVGRFFPEEWARFSAGAGGARDLVAAYHGLLNDPHESVRVRAAADWSEWEQVHVRRRDSRYDDPHFRLMFARLVTHYWMHAGFVEEGALMRDAGRLAGIPGVLIHGTKDISSPSLVAWRLSKAWPGSELVLLADAGHGAEPALVEAVVGALIPGRLS